MSAEIIQVNYQTLEDSVKRFKALAEICDDTIRQIHRRSQDLIGGGWEGEGAEAFEHEMNDMLLPKLKRLRDALLQTSQTLARIMQTMQEAEEDAKRLFGDEGGPGIGKGLYANKDTAKSPKELVDGGLYDKDGNRLSKPPQVIFIPGIGTTVDSFYEKFDMVGEHWEGKSIGGIYNHSDNFFSDSGQAFEDRRQAESNWRFGKNPAVDGLAQQILASNGQPLELVAHSQGAAITAAAMQEVKKMNPNFDFSKITVTTFGGFGTDFPPGANYKHYIHDGDPVPFIAAGTDFKLNPSSLKGYYKNVTVLPDGDMNPFNNHDMEQYLKNKDRFDSASENRLIRGISSGIMFMTGGIL